MMILRSMKDQLTDQVLRAGPIRETIARLTQRIEERFPASGLGRVARELGTLGLETERVVEQLGRPIWALRFLVALVIAAIVGIVGWAITRAFGNAGGWRADISDLLQGIDAGINELIFLSLTLYFFASLETRFKRRTALRMMHRLRGIAHVVDMHQLTKDPAHVLQTMEPTPSSPSRALSQAELVRYLDYCSELLALTSKLAALHGQPLQDPVVLDAVNDIESLTAGLSRKIWQKITIIDVAAAR
jgi:hypothetical protein